MIDKSTFFNAAFDQAFSRMGLTSPNPAVGAVIVKDDSIISAGSTRVCGGDHAEVCAISSAGDACLGADLYVTLEPCCHHGKTPPCTDAIIRSGIKRVFVPLEDPNPRVAGKGIAALRAAGIEVHLCDDFLNDAEQLARPFLTRIKQGRPQVMYKAAFTADGATATKLGDSKWISSAYSRYLVHRLRTIVDAVIVGKHTLETDNPSLNCRLHDFPPEVAAYFEKNPIRFSGARNAFMQRLAAAEFNHDIRSPLRICAGLPDNFSPDLNFMRNDNYLLFERKNRLNELLDAPGFEFLNSLIEKGNIISVPDGENLPEFIMEKCYEKGLLYLMLEGGGRLASSFFEAGCIDEYLFFTAPRILGGGLPVINGDGRLTMQDACELRDISIALCGSDLLYHGYTADE